MANTNRQIVGATCKPVAKPEIFNLVNFGELGWTSVPTLNLKYNTIHFIKHNTNRGANFDS